MKTLSLTIKINELSVIDRLKQLHKEADHIFNHTSLTWREKFDLIFSDNISEKVFNLVHLEYYDPDTDYEEDVTAFMSAFNELIERLNKNN